MTVKHTLVSLDMRVFALCSLMELHRTETARARSESVHPFCPRQSRRHIRLGADDRPVQYRAGADLHHYERRRLWGSAENRAACRNRDRRGGLRLF